MLDVEFGHVLMRVSGSRALAVLADQVEGFGNLRDIFGVGLP